MNYTEAWKAYMVEHIMHCNDKEILNTEIMTLAVDNADLNFHEWRSYTVWDMVKAMIDLVKEGIDMQNTIDKKQKKIDQLHQLFIDTI